MKLASQKSDLLKRQTRQWVEEFQNEGTHALTRYLASCASAYRFGDNATYCDIVAIVKPLLVVKLAEKMRFSFLPQTTAPAQSRTELD